MESSIDYNALIENHTIVTRANNDGIITYVNENYCHASGYSKEELIGQSHNILRHPDVSKNFYEKLWQALESGEIWHGVFRNINKNGQEYFTNATIFPVSNEKLSSQEYMSIHYLVTEDEHIKHNLKKQVLECKSDKIKQNRQQAQHDLELKQDIEQALTTKYIEYIKNMETELLRVRMAHKKGVVTIASLEEEIKTKTVAMESFSTKSKTTIKTLSSERVELLNSVESLRKSNESYKEKLEKAQESVVTFQGYIDEYRKKIEDLKDVIDSYESDKAKVASQEETSSVTQSEAVTPEVKEEDTEEAKKEQSTTPETNENAN